MKIFVKVKPRAKEAKVKKIDQIHFEVWVKEPAAEGLANDAILMALAKNFNVSKLRFKIVSGKSSRQKMIEVL